MNLLQSLLSALLAHGNPDPQSMSRMCAATVRAWGDLSAGLKVLTSFDRNSARVLQQWVNQPAARKHLCQTAEDYARLTKIIDDFVEVFATLQDLGIHVNGFQIESQPAPEPFKYDRNMPNATKALIVRQCMEHPDAKVGVRCRCGKCGTRIDLICPSGGFAAWITGAPIQLAMPDLTPAEREALISGLCEDCFDEITDDDEKDEND